MVDKQACSSIGGKVTEDGACKVTFTEQNCRQIGGEFRQGNCVVSEQNIKKALNKLDGDLVGNLKKS